MPKFDGTPYTELTNPEGDDLIGVCKDDSEADPSLATKYTKFSTLATWIIENLSTTRIDGLRLTWNSGTSISVGTGECYAENGDFIDVASAITLSSLSLSNDTGYHVYVYLDTGSAAEVVTTAPTAWKGDAYSKTGDTSRRYVGSLFTDSGGDVRYFWHSGNLMLYGRGDPLATPYRVASGLTASSATAVSCNGIVPATALSARIRISTNANRNLLIGDSALSTTSYMIILPAAVDDAQLIIEDIPLASQSFYYMYGAAVGAGSFNGSVLGYHFSR
jgi:hypothetical protein